MADIHELYTLVDQLPREELEQLNRYIQSRRMTRVWEVSSADINAVEDLLRPIHEQTELMDEANINADIDQALSEVRRERKAQNSH